MQKNKMIMEDELVPCEEAALPKGPFLVFAPHPDDETLGMGGTVTLAARSGIPVHVVFMTDGDMGADPNVRKEEARRAAAILGIDRLFHLGLGDREVGMQDLPETFLDDILKTTAPATLFLPSFQEIHPDHLATTRHGNGDVGMWEWGRP